MSAASILERMRARTQAIDVGHKPVRRPLVELLNREEVQRHFGTEELAQAMGRRVSDAYRAERGKYPRKRRHKVQVPHLPRPMWMTVNVYEPGDLELIRRALSPVEG